MNLFVVNSFIVHTAPDEVDDPVVVDGDLLLSKEHAAIYHSEGWDGLIKSQAWSRYTRRWDKNIPYAISGQISKNTTLKITRCCLLKA